MARYRTWRWLTIAIVLLSSVAMAAEPAPYMRVHRAGDEVSLQVAIRQFTPADGEGPTVHLAGAIHLGAPGYYDALQDHLDAQDLVLYEGVGWPKFLSRRATDDAGRIEETQDALSFLSAAIQSYHDRRGTFPISLTVLAQEAAQQSPLYGSWVKMASRDAWGDPVEYERAGDHFKLASSRGPNLRNPGGGPGLPAMNQDGLQTSMARALGLAFQLDAIDYNRPHFRNSDTSPMALARLLLADEGADGETGDPGEAQLRDLIETMDGQNLGGKLMLLAAKFIGNSERLQAMTRLMLIEVLGQLEGDMSQMQGLPPETAAFMRVLIQDRNEIVLTDLQALLEAEDTPDSISIFYGAGHMPDLEQRLETELNYQPAGDAWLTAFSVDVAETGLTPADLALMRTIIKAQMNAMQGQ